MNKSESKYFNTARRMDEALIELLEKKDLEYITVKEICQEAEVNRSTFYLHYETMGDLLEESVQYMNREFLEHMQLREKSFLDKIRNCPRQELYLVTPEYLTPYLEYIAANKRLFRAALKNSRSFALDKAYRRMMEQVFLPILERFETPVQDREYMMAFYIQGLMAIVLEWMKNDCQDSISHVSAVMEQCVLSGHHSRKEKK